MLDVINVSKDYYSGVKTSVLDDISFSVNEGDFVIVTGKSGSGKSTLSKSLETGKFSEQTHTDDSKYIQHYKINLIFFYSLF